MAPAHPSSLSQTSTRLSKVPPARFQGFAVEGPQLSLDGHWPEGSFDRVLRRSSLGIRRTGPHASEKSLSVAEMPQLWSESHDEGRGCRGNAGAGEGNRTLVVSLGSFCSTIELHPLRH